MGYVVAWSNVLRPGAGEALGDFVFVVAIPLLLFRTLSQATFEGLSPVPLWIAYFVPLGLTWLVASITIRRAFGRDERGGVVAGLAGSFSNTVLIGIPLVQNLYGETGFAALSLILTIHLPLIMAATVILFEVANAHDRPGTERADGRTLLRNFAQGMIKNPIVIGILAGGAWRFLDLHMPALPASIIDRIADTAVTLALISLGMSLRRFGITRNVPQALVVTVLKSALMPALATVFCLALALPPIAAQVVIVTAAMPTGVNPYLIASRFGTGEALASNAMVIATAVAPITLAFWIWVAATVT